MHEGETDGMDRGDVSRGGDESKMMILSIWMRWVSFAHSKG